MNERNSGNYIIKRRPLWLCLILSAVTCGVYLWIWFYKALKDSNRISNKKRKVTPLFVAAVVTYILGICFLFASLSVLFFFGRPMYPITPAFMMELEMSVAVTMFILMTVGLVCIVCTLALTYTLLYFLSKNLEEGYVYYLVPYILFGLIIPLLFAQSSINDYAGNYNADEKPRYLGSTVSQQKN